MADDKDLERISNELRDVRDAGLIAHGRDGKNGRLSETRDDLAALDARTCKAHDALQSRLWGLLVGVGVSLLVTGYNSCIVSERRQATVETKIQNIEKALVSVGEGHDRLEQRIERIQAAAPKP